MGENQELVAENFTEVVLPGDSDVLAMLLADKRSENTRRAYAHDVQEFFAVVYESAPTPELVRHFLALSTPQMAAVLLRYKARLISEKLAEATVNRRIAAVMSLIKFARRVGATEADPRSHIDSEKVVAYRDTRGISRLPRPGSTRSSARLRRRRKRSIP